MNKSQLNSALNRSLTKPIDLSHDIVLGYRNSVPIETIITNEDQKPSIKLMSYAE